MNGPDRRAVPRRDRRDVNRRRRASSGLLSIAFAPDYAASGRFYVFFTAAGEPGQRARRVIVVEGRRSAADPNRGRARRRCARSSRSRTRAPQPQRRPARLRARRRALREHRRRRQPASRATRAERRQPARQDPALRPAAAGATPAVWALGLRNPWRFSFDRRDRRRADRRRRRGHEGGDRLRAPSGTARGPQLRLAALRGRRSARRAQPASTPPVLDVRRAATGYSAMIGGFVVRDPGLPCLPAATCSATSAKRHACSRPRSAPTRSPRPEPDAARDRARARSARTAAGTSTSR